MHFYHVYRVHVHGLYTHHVPRIAVRYNLSLTYFSYDYGNIQVYCASSVKLMPVPQAMSQIFAILPNIIPQIQIVQSENVIYIT